MSSVTIYPVLVTFAPDPETDYDPWLRHHLGLGFARIIVYQRPGHMKKTTSFAPFEGAGQVVRRRLLLDVGPPLKSAIFAAMTQDGLPEGAFALALNCDEFLNLAKDGSLVDQIAALPHGASAWVLPVSSQESQHQQRTIFDASAFETHNGARPILALGVTDRIWCDAAGQIADENTLFWGNQSNTPQDKAAHVTKGAAGLPMRAIQTSGIEPTSPDQPLFLNPQVNQPDWYKEITQGEIISGFFEQLTYQSLVMIKRPSDQLVVTFDNLSTVNDAAPDRAPWAYKFLRETGCAHLGIFAHRKDWYRDPDLIAALTRLRDDGIFAGYRDVLFCGTSMGGFAALVFSSLVPGARVLAFSPQSTLDETIVPWETRFGMGRMRNWRLPFSDAAFEIETASDVVIISDPYFTLDQRHVARLKSPNVRQLSAWFSGHFSPVFLRRANLLKPVMQAMIEEKLTPAHFYSLYRARRGLPWYKRAMEDMLVARGRDTLAARVSPAFRKARRANQSGEAK